MPWARTALAEGPVDHVHVAISIGIGRRCPRLGPLCDVDSRRNHATCTMTSQCCHHYPIKRLNLDFSKKLLSFLFIIDIFGPFLYGDTVNVAWSRSELALLHYPSRLAPLSKPNRA